MSNNSIFINATGLIIFQQLVLVTNGLLLLGLKYLLFSSGAPLNIKVWNNFASYGVSMGITTTERTTFTIILRVNLSKSIAM